MSEPTVSSMHDARDAEDKRLLEAKEHTQLLENYVYLVQEWVAIRVRDRFSPSDVTAVLACEHLTTLSLAHARGDVERPEVPDEQRDLIFRDGPVRSWAWRQAGVMFSIPN